MTDDAASLALEHMRRFRTQMGRIARRLDLID